VQIFTLTSGAMKVRVTSYGARLVSIRTPDRTGKVADVELGYDSLEDYLNDTKTRFGAVIRKVRESHRDGAFFDWWRSVPDSG